MSNWHKHPNLKLNSASAILANLPARKTGIIKTFRPHQDPEVFLILAAGISKALSMSVPHSDFRGATLGHEPKTLSLYQLTDNKRWQFPSVMFHLSMNGESQILSWHWSTEGGEARRAEKQKRKHEEKFNKFSPHT